MENIFQEFSGYHGTLVKPYYWLYSNQHCSKCPYHIRTGEESRVTFGEFYEAFGFPYGPTMPENKQLIFYEIKAFNGAVIQKGQVTNCTYSNIHGESILFDKHGYLDSFLYKHDSVGYLTLYANFTPCNEYGQCCISRMYDLLIKYPQMRLDIYFSQMYHIEEEFPVAVWNREALKSLAGHWPRVTLNPLSDGIWKTVLYGFVKEVPETTLYEPILPARATADSYNAYMIHLITGIKPYFVTEPPVSQPQETNSLPEYYREKRHFNSVPWLQNGNNNIYPFFIPRMPFVLPSHVQTELASKPKLVVRHLNMPGSVSGGKDLSESFPNVKKSNEVSITKQVVRGKEKSLMENRKKKRKV
ncbi:putative C-_U-editing enzyme APOBEC-4 [Pseudophryne corroboree]|uniref:putative C->U-editing enzyme APOBEC-4 n=1 Tax=Pseudophryne corroboree TaxID=495146 RepID=UPI0030818C0C